MDLRFKVSGRIARPVHDVYEAVANPDVLSSYFTTGGSSARLEPGATVYWDFADFPGAFPVEVVEAIPDKRIVFRWGSGDGSDNGSSPTTVTIEFEPLEDGRTLVTISEEGWPDTESGLRSSYGNCEGWTGALCAMKAWLEHGINLREGFYV